MGMTMTQKILAAHAGLPSVSAGQLIEAELDLVLGNDITSPVAIHEMDKMKVDGVFDKDKVRQIYFVAETKGTDSEMEKRGIENLKIHCADEHFKEISNCEVKFAAVSSYEKMMDIVQLK